MMRYGQNTIRNELGVDFDYWPRVELYTILPRKSLFFITTPAQKRRPFELKKQYGDAHIDIEKDEHYQCHKCYSDYADISANLPGRG
jgi:hypothetical protein